MCANEPQKPCRQGSHPGGKPLESGVNGLRAGAVDATERLQAAFTRAAIEGESTTSSSGTSSISSTIIIIITTTTVNDDGDHDDDDGDDHHHGGGQRH